MEMHSGGDDAAATATTATTTTTTTTTATATTNLVTCVGVPYYGWWPMF